MRSATPPPSALPSAHSTPPAPSSKAAVDPQPMDLDHTKSKNPPQICYNCNKPGHITCNCLEPCVMKMGRKPREGILCSLPCLILRARAMSEAQPKGTNSLCSRCTMVCDRTGPALWLWQPHK